MSTQTKDNIQTECLNVLFKHKKAGAAVTMGVGKTRIGLRHMRNMYEFGFRNFLVAAPKKAIYKSWKDEAVLLKWEFLLEHITFTTYRSLHKLTSDYDAIYLDECHSLLPTHVSFLQTQTGRIVGFTGTPPKTKGSEKYNIVNNFCPIVYNYFVDEAVNENILNDYKIIVHGVKLNHENTIKVEFKNGGSKMTSEEENYRYWTEKILTAEGSYNRLEQKRLAIGRMSAMKKYTSKELYMQNLIKDFDEKVILFCNTKEQADRISDYSYHSSNPESEKNLEMFKKGLIPYLTCVNQLNEGVNIPNLRYGVIMHAYGNERQASQRIGRLLRLNPDEKAYIHILMYKDTIDEKWVNNALSDFDSSKIEFYNVEPKTY
jgi:superfamily II DNA or RNA helicase